MAEEATPFDDDLGPELLDRSGDKLMGGDAGGQGLDASWDDALRILGQEDSISPVVQEPLWMQSPPANELARRLTALRMAAGAGPTLLLATDADAAPLSPAAAVEAFVAALQEAPADLDRLAELRARIETGGDRARDALRAVCEHPGVQAKLAGEPAPRPPLLDPPHG